MGYLHSQYYVHNTPCTGRSFQRCKKIGQLQNEGVQLSHFSNISPYLLILFSFSGVASVAVTVVAEVWHFEMKEIRRIFYRIATPIAPDSR
jgi:hypothetical protein